MLKIEQIKVGKERTNCYILSSDGEVAIIDPGAEPEKILSLVPSEKKLRYILLTHGHYDHVGGVDGIRKRYPHTPVLLHENDVKLYDIVPEQGVFVGELLRQPHADLEALSEGEILPLGEYELEVFSTPGHTPGSVSFFVDNYIFTGDTLFYHTIGRTDLPFSNEKDLKHSLDKLIHLEEGLIVYPGHGKQSTIGEEKYHNPHII